MTAAQSNLRLSTFKKYLRSCIGEVTRDVVHGEPRVMCQLGGNVPAVFEAIGDQRSLSKVSLFVSVPSAHIAESLLMGLNFIRDASGRKAGEIAPDGWIQKLAVQEQSFGYSGLTITTTPMTQIGMIGYAVSSN